MATLLNRLGRGAFERRRAVVAGWLLILVLSGVFAAAFNGIGSGTSLSIPGTESQDARDALSREFPRASGATGTIAIKAGPGRTLFEGAGSSAVGDIAADAAAVDGVVGVVTPEQSGAITDDGQYAIVSVQFDAQANEISTEAKDEYERLGQAASESTGMTVAAGGEIAAEDPAVGATEIIGVFVAAIVLIVTFGSVVAAGSTLLTALIGVGVGMAGILAVSGIVDFNAVTPILALMLGLAVGIDYALFITARFRQERERGHDGATAAGLAIGTAGSSVVFAGITVMIALAALSAVGIPFLRAMGLAAAGAVLVAVVVALTLTPAMLGFAGDRVWSKRPDRRTKGFGRGRPSRDTELTMGARWAGFVTRNPIKVMCTVILGLVVVALPAGSMQLGLPTNGSAPTGTPARAAYDLVTEGFGEGYNSQIVVVTDTDDAQSTRVATDELRARLQTVQNVANVVPAQFSASGTTSLTVLIPSGGPDDRSTKDIIDSIRTRVAPELDADVAVTGVVAVASDVSDKLARALPVYIALVIGLSLMLLALVFRSILVPIKAALGFLLTTAATFGATVAVFQWGWLSTVFGVDQTTPIISFLPIILIGVTFGLSMDYEVFLVSRMREEFVHGTPAEDATVTGFTHSARVVTAAAIIMVAVFASFMLAPDITVKMMGFSLTVGILIDAFLVRMTIVPAVMTLLSDRAWWLPAWLDRILPNVDIEGSALNAERSGGDINLEQLGLR